MIRSLEQKKFRTRENSFVAEGPKVVGDLLAVMRPKLVIATSQWISENNTKGIDVETVSEDELSRIKMITIKRLKENLHLLSTPFKTPETLEQSYA